MGILKVWVGKHSEDCNTLCVRMGSIKEYPQIALTTYEYPPLDDKTMSINEAKKRGLSQEHHILSMFSNEDLIKIRDSINRFLSKENITHV